MTRCWKLKARARCGSRSLLYPVSPSACLKYLAIGAVPVFLCTEQSATFCQFLFPLSFYQILFFPSHSKYICCGRFTALNGQSRAML